MPNRRDVIRGLAAALGGAEIAAPGVFAEARSDHRERRRRRRWRRYERWAFRSMNFCFDSFVGYDESLCDSAPQWCCLEWIGWSRDGEHRRKPAEGYRAHCDCLSRTGCVRCAP